MTRWAILTGEYPPQPGGVSESGTPSSDHPIDWEVRRFTFAFVGFLKAT